MTDCDVNDMLPDGYYHKHPHAIGWEMPSYECVRCGNETARHEHTMCNSCASLIRYEEQAYENKRIVPAFTPCPHCDGEGYIPLVNPSAEQSEHVCSACGGKGTIEGSEK